MITFSVVTLLGQNNNISSQPVDSSPLYSNQAMDSTSTILLDQAQQIPDLWWIVPLAALLALLTCVSIFKTITKNKNVDAKVNSTAVFINADISKGTIAQYQAGFATSLIIFIVLLAMSFFGLQSGLAPFAFVSGGILVLLANKICFQLISSTAAPVVQACHQNGQSGGLNLVLRIGTAAGLAIIGIAMLGICGWYCFLDLFVFTSANLQSGVEWFGICIVPMNLSPEDKFTFIANLLLLFSFGASVQSLFAGISGAGNRHHYIFGMNANIFTAFVTAITATSAIGTVLPIASGDIDEAASRFVTPMLIAGFGIIISMLVLSMVKFKDSELQRNMRRCLLACFAGANITVAIAMSYLVYMNFIDWGMYLAAVTGIVAGILIGQSDDYYFVKILRATKLSVLPPPLGQNAILLSATLLCSFGFAGGFADFYSGFYGIALAATGLLAGSIIPLAAAISNSVVSNAANIAKMSSLPQITIDNVSALAVIEQSPANLSRSYSAVAAAMSGLTLPAVFVLTAKTSCMELIQQSDIVGLDVTAEELANSSIPDFMLLYQMFILNPFLLAGMLIGVMLPFFMHALLKPSVENHVRAGKNMFVTAFIVLNIPVIASIFLGVPGAIGLIVGMLFCGILLTMNPTSIAGNEINNACLYDNQSRLPYLDYQNPAIHILLFAVPMLLIMIVPAIIKYAPIIKTWLNIQV
jgi:Na+/H+-translocating membrane pyrophosphatase